MAGADKVDPKAAIREKALALGFDAVGFAPAALSGEARDNLAHYLGQGLHGDMGWLAAKADRRGDPRTLWPDAKSVIVLGMNYGPAEPPNAHLGEAEAGVVSVYARGRDYHDVVKSRLKALGRWLAEDRRCQVKVFVDTAPVMEKPLAEAAGIGWQGKHTNLVSRDFGSWLFLGEVFTDLVLEPDMPHADACGACRACLDACPTAAFPAPYRLDARRCISYLTIEHKGAIPIELRPLLGNRIYGCDDCLAACPWNKFATPTSEPDLLPRNELTAPRLAELAALDDAGFRRLFAGSAVKRLGRDRFVRNVLIAIGNSGEPALAQVAGRLLDDDAAVVRGAAAWAFGRIASAAAVAAARVARERAETEEEVRLEWRVSPAEGHP
ncbi:MAG: tRNA epoxyqueuosine(34) reductase QueG [Alphaproteobacteria bacterium]|nr:tRNA epoxyqueuosine(34) reductase QueG [Alphaproteobacteria bacterium]